MTIFGQNAESSSKAHCRRLQCKDPRVVRKYVTVYTAFLATHNLYSRASTLENSVTEGQYLTRQQSEEFERIDRLRVKGMALAEKRCRRLKMGRYWHLHWLRLRGHNIGL